MAGFPAVMPMLPAEGPAPEAHALQRICSSVCKDFMPGQDSAGWHQTTSSAEHITW